MRNLVYINGALDIITDIVVKGLLEPRIEKLAIWCISNICIIKPHLDFNQVKIAIPALAYALGKYLEDDEALLDICWAFSNLSDGGE